MRRKHGFERPHNWSQRFAAGSSVLTTALFCIGTLPFLPVPELYFASVVYALMTTITVVMWASLTASDPTDMTTNGRKWCIHCNLFVNIRSWHCKQCERCVINLDHHCKWLNNCIGEMNYRRFVGLCVFFLGQACVEFAFASIVVEKLASRDQTTIDLAKARLSESETVFAVCVVFTSIALGAAAVRALLILHLMLFHAYLRCHGLTTYTFVLQRLRKEQTAIIPSVEGGHIEIETKINMTSTDDYAGELHQVAEHQEDKRLPMD